MAAYEWTKFTAFKDGSTPILKEERDELWTALADLLARCGGRWKLTEAKMTLVRDHGSITDLTFLEDSEDEDETAVGDLAKVLIDIRDTFTGTTGYDAFKHVAPDEGLDDDKLAEMITDTGRVQGSSDDYKLWNLYKRVLDYLQCCPSTPPVFEWESRSAVADKCGLYVSGSNRRYRRSDWSGSFTLSRYGEDHCAGEVRRTLTSSPSGGFDSDSADCSISGTLTVGYTDSGGDGRTDHFSPLGSGSSGRDMVDTYMGYTHPESYLGELTFTEFNASFTVSRGDDFCIWTGAGCADVDTTRYSASGSTRVDLTDEVTDEQFIDELIESLPDWDNDWNDTAGYYFYVSSDRLFAEIREGKPRIPLAGLSLTVGKKYRAYYFRRFIPVGVGAPTAEDEEFLEFTFAEGMTHTEEIEIERPVDGTNILVGVRWECEPFDDEEDGE